jgi:peptide/nickel transport system substrate-binding protein
VAQVSGGRAHRSKGAVVRLWRLRGVLLLAALSAVAFAAGLGSALAAEPSASPSDGKVVLKVGLLEPPDSLNPFVGYGTMSYEAWCLNYDFVLGYGAEDGSPVPGIAESWSVSPDGKTWTFKIRQGAVWSDGVPVTARDVAFSYNYIVQKDLSAYSSYTKLIDEAVAIDDYTCEVRCSKPKANMERLYIYCFPEHIWSKIAKPEKYKVTYPFVGSGPFLIQEWKRGSYIRMTKNPDYWGTEPTVDEILFEFYTNADTMTQDLKSGLIDAAYGVPPAQYEQVAKLDGFQGFRGNLYTWDYICFNCYDQPSSLGHPVLRDVKFRQALNWAVDKERLVAIGWNGFARPATSIMPPGEWPADFDAHYEPTADEAYGFDLAKANQLLDEAGYADSNGDGIREYKGKNIRLRLAARTQSAESQAEGKLVAGWFKQCGLDIRYSVIEDGALSDALYNYDKSGAYAPDYDIYLWSYAGYADPGDTLASFITDQIEWWNDPCWSNAEYDGLCDLQFSQLDKAERLDSIYRMQQIFYVESPQIALTYPDTVEVADTAAWEGWVPYLGGLPVLNGFNMDTYLSLKPKAVAASSSSSSSTTWVIVGVVVVLVVIVLVVVLTRRGRGRAVEE